MYSNELLLLKIIDVKGRISLLIDRGLSHSQVAMLIRKQEEEGNIEISDTIIKLTIKGQKLLNEDISLVKLKEKDKWILPQEHRYNTPLSFKEIVLPKGKKI